MDKDLLFEGYLKDYQGDLKSIVLAHRLSKHHLTAEEIVADVNLSLYKKREDIMGHLPGDFEYVDFCKVAYRYAVNITKWSAQHYKIQKEKKYRLNEAHTTEDGVKSSFDFIIGLEGVEDPDFKKIFSSDQAQYFLKYVREYSQLLSPLELHIVSLLEVGKNQTDVAVHLDVTRQAVSICLIKLAKKLRSNIKFDYKSDFPAPNGAARAAAFFDNTPPHHSISENDRIQLMSHLLAHKGKYTFREVAAAFKNGRYSPNQILKLAQHMGVYNCFKKAQVCGWPPSDVDRLLEMVNDGWTICKIANSFGEPYPHLIRRKCQHLRSKGLISRIPHMGQLPKKLTPRDKQILKLFKQGLACREVSSQLKLPPSVVSGKKRWFLSRNLLVNSS